ncbi:MAG TPA: pitrilysin family protein [Anaerolineae bacterium]|nr:pitrilysin family protein [Anaerolineae bacterium]
MKAEAALHVSRSTQHDPSIPGPETIQRRAYANGMVVLVKENFSSPVVVVDGTLRFGGVNVPREQAGLASFMTDVLMRGTQQRTFQQLYEEIESVGATLDVSAGLNVSGFGSKSLAESLPSMIELLADVLQRPTFPEPEVEKVRGEILTDVEERANDTRRMAGLTFRELLYPDTHPYSISGLGYAETIRSLTRDDLEQFYRARVGAHGMIVAIVGAVKADEAFRLWEDAFGNWAGAPTGSAPIPDAPRLTETRRRAVSVPGKTQSDLVLGCIGPRRTAPDYFPAALGNTVLGVFGLNGRIGEKVRVKGGMAYYAYSSVEGGLGPGAWSVIAGVNPANVDRAVELIRTEIKRIRDTKVSAKELADNKAFITGLLPLRLETNDGVADQIANMELYGLGLDYLQQYTDMINRITGQQVQAAAQKYLDPAAYALAVAGPANH